MENKKNILMSFFLGLVLGNKMIPIVFHFLYSLIIIILIGVLIYLK